MVVFQAVGGFVLDLGIGRLLLHADGKTATLNHEAGNHAVKHGAVVMALVDVVQEVGDGFRRFGFVQLKRDDAVIGDVEFYFWMAHGVL